MTPLLVQLQGSKKALEEEGNKKDEELVRSFIRFGTGTGVFLSSLPLVGPVRATVAGIGAADLSEGNELEIIKQVLLFGAVGKVFEKLRKIPIINQAEGKVLAWVRNLVNQGRGAAKVKIKNPVCSANYERISKRAPEILRGEISEGGFLNCAEKYLGKGYKEVSPGRYLSKDGLRQVRYGAHETTGKIHHAHFEAYDKVGGTVVENSRVIINPTK